MDPPEPRTACPRAPVRSVLQHPSNAVASARGRSADHSPNRPIATTAVVPGGPGDHQRRYRQTVEGNHEHSKNTHAWRQISIFLTVLSLGMRASLAEILYLFRRPGQLIRALLSVYVVMPVVAILMVTIFTLDPVVEVVISLFRSLLFHRFFQVGALNPAAIHPSRSGCLQRSHCFR